MKETNREAVERIQQMEQLFDRVSEILRKRGSDSCKDKELSEHLGLLAEYMDSGLWRQDYELDESGALPPNLKRGVLSQDGLYDLLTAFRIHETT